MLTFFLDGRGRGGEGGVWSFQTGGRKVTDKTKVQEENTEGQEEGPGNDRALREPQVRWEDLLIHGLGQGGLRSQLVKSFN